MGKSFSAKTEFLEYEPLTPAFVRPTNPIGTKRSMLELRSLTRCVSFWIQRLGLPLGVSASLETARIAFIGVSASLFLVDTALIEN
jgi:hypothetical protein